MKPIVDILEERVVNAIAEATGETAPGIVKPTQDAKFGDYQANGVMGLAKKRKQNPRQLAEKIIEQLKVSDLCEEPEIAGPGFINFRLKPDGLSRRITEAIKDHKRLGVNPIANPPRTVVDFSSPNIAKQMHVGHLRSTIIGDVIARILEFRYDDKNRWDFKPDPDDPENYIHNPEKLVLRQNHVGDWGTQFGKVVLGLWHWCMSEKHCEQTGTNYIIDELNQLKKYKTKTEAKPLLENICTRSNKDWKNDSKDKRGDGELVFHPFLTKLHDTIEARENIDEIWKKSLASYQYINLVEEMAEGLGIEVETKINGKYVTISFESLSRLITTMVQKKDEKGNEQEKQSWHDIRELSLEHCHRIYKTLGVSLERKHVRGESKYSDDLSEVVEILKKESKVDFRISEGAGCVFLPGFKRKDGEPLPMIVQKSDEAYNYNTTDLAAIRYRINTFKANRLIYVTDSRQIQHFDTIFACAQQAGWLTNQVKPEHVTFGSILGPDQRPLKTRSGENIILEGLLEEAVARARQVVEDKNPGLSEDKKQEIANAVGIGAVKYADLSNNLVSDYVFDWDKMLAMDGNTAPYMQYAYARVQSIFRKGQIDPDELLAQDHALELTELEELALAKLLLRYGEIVETVARDLRPHLLTGYLYDLAQAFSGFYTNCPVLKADGNTRSTRLLLCYQTAQTIRHGLDLLGIQTIEQM